MRLVITLCCALIWSWSFAYGDEGREAVRLSLPQDLARLAQAHEQLRAAYTTAGSTLPNAFNDVVVVRRTIAADWQKKLNDPTQVIDELAAARFHQELVALIAATQQLSNTAQQYSYASQRFPHCLDEPVLKKYRAQLVADVDAGLQAIIAGRVLENNSAKYRTQRRYTNLLTIIEAQYTLKENYEALPAHLPALIDYKEHLRVTRTKLESSLDAADSLDDEFNAQEITNAFVMLLNAHVEATNTVTTTGLSKDNVAVKGYHLAITNHIAVLTDNLKNARSIVNDDDLHDQRQQAAQQKQVIASHLVSISERWMQSEADRQNQRTTIQEQQDRLSAAGFKQVEKSLSILDANRKKFETSLTEAIIAQDAIIALQQFGAIDALTYQEQYTISCAVDDAQFALDEANWVKFEKDPDVSKFIANYQNKKAAFQKARDYAYRTNLKIRELDLNTEVSALQSELLQQQADRQDDETYRLLAPLEEAAEAVNEAVELRSEK